MRYFSTRLFYCQSLASIRASDVVEGPLDVVLEKAVGGYGKGYGSGGLTLEEPGAVGAGPIRGLLALDLTGRSM